MVTAIKKCKQGSFDPESAWSKARYGWVAQLGLRTGVIKIHKLEPRDRWRPGFINLRNHRLCLCQIVFWDETHKEIFIGGHGHGVAKNQIRIPRARDGKVDIVHGDLAEEIHTLNIKYTSQTRLLVGVAKVELPDGTIEGRRCVVYQYDDCWVVTIGEYEDVYIPWQLKKIKNLTNKGSWITGKRPDKGEGVDLYEQDPVTRLPGLGDTRKKQLGEFAIRNVLDFKGLTDVDIDMLERSIRGLSADKLRTWRTLAQTSIPGSYVDTTVDHTLADNPYESRASVDVTFAPNGWRDVIASDLRKSRNVVCITELVEHIIKASKKVSRRPPPYCLSLTFHHLTLHS